MAAGDRGQLELRGNAELPDPTVRVLACCGENRDTHSFLPRPLQPRRL